MELCSATALLIRLVAVVEEERQQQQNAGERHEGGRGVPDEGAEAHPDEAQAMFMKANPDLNDELNRRAWADTLPRFDKRPAAMDKGRYERFAAFLKEKGLVKSLPPVDTYAVELP